MSQVQPQFKQVEKDLESGARTRDEPSLCYSLVLSLGLSHLTLWVLVFSSAKWGS